MLNVALWEMGLGGGSSPSVLQKVLLAPDKISTGHIIPGF